MFSLFPREEDFFLLFRKQAVHVREACTALHAMMENFDRLEARAKELKEIELRADEVTHEIFERLNRTFITPLDREDIHDLASGLDNVVDAAEAIASRVVLFRVGAPTPEAVHMSQILKSCGEQIEQAAGSLKNMKNLVGFTIEIKRLENEADAISRHVVADLFSRQHDILDILRWKELYGRLENATDQCEDVANTIESIVIKSS